MHVRHGNFPLDTTIGHPISNPRQKLTNTRTSLPIQTLKLDKSARIRYKPLTAIIWR